MPKNLVVCCDGTANEFKRDRTNVVKLCSAMIKDPARQLVYYHPGIGTMAAPGFVTGLGAFLARVAGQAFGYGLKDDIGAAYAFIMDHYCPGDRIYLFGFSRGAYTARAIAALLHLYGRVPAGNEGLVPYAVRMFWAISKVHNTDKAAAYFKLAAQFKEALGAPCPVHFVGLWDTVSSVGWIGSPVALAFTKTNPEINIARHAVSIDERRAFFRTNLLSAAPGQDLQQVWFPGVHCDVGGGYREAESGLSKIALKWMADEAQASGLLLDATQLQRILGKAATTGTDGKDDNDPYMPPDPTAPMHRSLTPGWWPAEFLPKRYFDRTTDRVTWRMNLFRHRSMGVAPCVHDEAWNVSPAYAAKLPVDAVPLSKQFPKRPRKGGPRQDPAANVN